MFFKICVNCLSWLVKELDFCYVSLIDCVGCGLLNCVNVICVDWVFIGIVILGISVILMFDLINCINVERDEVFSNLCDESGL